MRVMRRWLWLKRRSQVREARGKVGEGRMVMVLGGLVLVEVCGDGDEISKP